MFQKKCLISAVLVSFWLGILPSANVLAANQFKQMEVSPIGGHKRDLHDPGESLHGVKFPPQRWGTCASEAAMKAAYGVANARGLPTPHLKSGTWLAANVEENDRKRSGDSFNAKGFLEGGDPQHILTDWEEEGICSPDDVCKKSNLNASQQRFICGTEKKEENACTDVSANSQPNINVLKQRVAFLFSKPEESTNPEDIKTGIKDRVSCENKEKLGLPPAETDDQINATKLRQLAAKEIWERGEPFIIGADSAFFIEGSKNPPAIEKDKNGRAVQFGAGHALVVSGYDGKNLIVDNSWGDNCNAVPDEPGITCGADGRVTVDIDLAAPYIGTATTISKPGS